MGTGKAADIVSSDSKMQVSEPRQRSAPYPRYDLEQVEKLARVVFDMGARNCDQDIVAREYGYKNADNGAFKSLKGSANYFGLLKADGQYLSVTDEWISAFMLDDTAQLIRARQEAMHQPTLYAQLFEEFGGRQLPKPDRLAMQLHLQSKFGIRKEAADIAEQVFRKSAEYSGLINERGFLVSDLIDLRERTDEIGRRSNPPKNVSSQELSIESGPETLEPSGRSETAYTERYEVHLRGGRKAVLQIPVPLQPSEKDRLKSYIDLILEDEILQGNTT